MCSGSGCPTRCAESAGYSASPRRAAARTELRARPKGGARAVRGELEPALDAPPHVHQQVTGRVGGAPSQATSDAVSGSSEEGPHVADAKLDRQRPRLHPPGTRSAARGRGRYVRAHRPARPLAATGAPRPCCGRSRGTWMYTCREHLGALLAGDGIGQASTGPCRYGYAKLKGQRVALVGREGRADVPRTGSTSVAHAVINRSSPWESRRRRGPRRRRRGWSRTRERRRGARRPPVGDLSAGRRSRSQHERQQHDEQRHDSSASRPASWICTIRTPWLGPRPSGLGRPRGRLPSPTGGAAARRGAAGRRPRFANQPDLSIPGRSSATGVPRPPRQWLRSVTFKPWMHGTPRSGCPGRCCWGLRPGGAHQGGLRAARQGAAP